MAPDHPRSGVTLSFQIPAPSSSKNSRQLVRTRGKKLRSLPSKKAKESKLQIETAAINALRSDLGVELKKGETLFGDRDISISIVHFSGADAVQVIVREATSAGTSSRKRDLQNLPEAICDALQGIAFDNDNQITYALLTRTV